MGHPGKEDAGSLGVCGSGAEVGGGHGWGTICCGFGWGESREHVEEPIKRKFWRRTPVKVREEQSLRRSLEGMVTREEENEEDDPSWKPGWRVLQGAGGGTQILQRGE